MCGGTHGKGDVRSRSHTPTTYTLAQGHPAPRRDLAGPRQSSACQGQATATCALREETAGLLRHLWLRAEPDRVPGHANNAGVKMRAWLGRLCAPSPSIRRCPHPLRHELALHAVVLCRVGAEEPLLGRIRGVLVLDDVARTVIGRLSLRCPFGSGPLCPGEPVLAQVGALSLQRNCIVR